ncbi:NAD(P)-dependent oxidoreductase [Leucothrix sargassi]|nr:NAD(P)-dependent oxidoreductase [Leucothrix sargassi]
MHLRGKSMSKQKVAFIGLGVMGYPMAGHLAAAGHTVCVYNRTTSKAETWVAEHGGHHAETPAAAAEGADFVFSCVGNDDDLRSVTIGEQGAFKSMKTGAMFIDHTTASATVAREVAATASDLGFCFMDAPVSGGQAGAENGVLTVMTGGCEICFDSAKPLIECYAQSVKRMGDSGAGQLTKMVNQICIAGLLQGLSEGVAFAQNAGLDAEQVFEVIGKGAAQSWQMDNRHQTMLENKFDYGFAVDWMRKDLGLCFDEAQTNGSELPVTKLVDSFYKEVQENGGNRFDTSSLVTRLPRK